MTASAARRRRSTLVALGVTVATLVLAGGITVVGASTLLNSREGRNAAGDALPTLELPATPTAFVGLLGSDGALVSAAALVMAPSGVGGSIVVVPANADSSLGLGDDRFPLAETLALEGADRLRADAEATLSVSFDIAELVDHDRLVALLEPLGALTVENPVDVVDAEGDIVLAAGEATIDAATAAAVLTAAAPGAAANVFDPARLAVWQAVADAAGSATAGEPPDDAAAPRTLDEFANSLFAGSLGARALSCSLPDDEPNPRQVDTVIPDRAEVLLVFGQIAPSRVAAPNQSLTFRIESSFDDEDLAAHGVNNADIARDVINRLLYAQANVVSVVRSDDSPPDVTQAYVSDGAVSDIVAENYPLVFGELEVVPAEFRIEGVDVTVVLGRSYLDVFAASIPDDLLEVAADFAEDDDS